MTDLEITKRCAEAMGLPFIPEPRPQPSSMIRVLFITEAQAYDPFHDDAQAMALVKKFMLDCWFDPGRGSWKAQYSVEAQSESDDLNRAICECVAKMQEAKSGQRDAA